MSASQTLRCVMEIRTCGLFWHRVIVSLTLDPYQGGLLTIARPKLFGGKLRIPLNHKYQLCSLASVSEKEARHYQLGIYYGSSRQRVTLRAPTSAVYGTWWAALQDAFTPLKFAVVDAPTHQVPLAPVRSARHHTTQSKHTTTLETVSEVERDSVSIEEVPMLEAGGPSSLTELDILASWRTWGSLDYFATPPNNTSSLTSHDEPECEDGGSCISTNDDFSDKNSIYSDISEFWSRPSEFEDRDYAATDLTVAARAPESLEPPHPYSPQPQDDEAWLDEIALFAFRHKVNLARKSEQRPNRRAPPIAEEVCHIRTTAMSLLLQPTHVIIQVMTGKLLTNNSSATKTLTGGIYLR